MKNIVIVIILTLTLNCFSQTQAEMDNNAYAEFNKADKELNKVYQKILTEYKSDSIFVKNLKNAQNIWVKFRDAELEMKYPNYKELHYGTSYSMCKNYYLKELTKERTKKLKVWLIGIKEGEICSGSVKIN